MNDDALLAELKQLLPHCLLKDQVRIGRRLMDWGRQRSHPRGAIPALGRLLAEARDSVSLRERKQALIPPLSYPPALPITARRAEIVAAIKAHQVVVIAGETGSGKTTQLPKMCLEAGLGVRAKIGCTQPRRVAALSLSRRLAEELDREWGREVGCKIRFSDQTRPETCVKFMTDGILLAETQADPTLCEYDAIIIDEAHERSLNIDFLLGHLKQLLARRDDLKLIITSATIDTQSFSKHFNDAPIIEVSGRMFPVEVVYAPFDPQCEERGEITYVDAAVEAVGRILEESQYGDLLVFMPSERDIIETRDALQERRSGGVELVPLFGRLSPEDQQRVFAPSRARRVVIATNIAETSLTVPGIRFVVDTGLARMSHYQSHTRAKRLPIEPISQSSANQRKGRCGRVEEGICVRLYSEEDFQSRPPYTQPEIQRANLAEVILRMKAFQLGDMEVFPFLNPPTAAAVQGGYRLLQEIGALDPHKELTDIGRRLARLPIDPTIGRMILQAQKEHALKEVLIIAAGLSIQDPRERPMDQQDAASAAHRRFHHPTSDFLTLHNIWEAYHDTWDSFKTQSQMRRFCKAHFLSYPRMREWRDLHAQIHEALEDIGDFVENRAPASYEAVHRSILTGLWGHVATRRERNLFELGGGRQVMVFPGSGLFERVPENRPGQQKKSPPSPTAPKTAAPKWIVAGEVVETSRVYLRTVAAIDPLWIVELAPHLCKRTYLEPHWDAGAGRVQARERVTLNGLLVLDQMVSYGNVNSAEATEIFIRSALVEEGMADHFNPPQRRTPQLPQPEEPTARRDLSTLPALYRFLSHNHQLRQKIEMWQTRLLQRVVPDLDEALFQAYTRSLKDVSSIPELNRVLRAQPPGPTHFLCLTEADLLGPDAGALSPVAFPDAVAIGNQSVPLSYAYAPGEERDGVTVRLPFTLAQVVEPGLLDWAVPGLREQQILHLLHALPKTLRRPLMPLAPKAKEMAEAVAPEGRAFLAALIQFVRHRYGVAIPLSAWSAEVLPAHLRPRFEIIGKDRLPVAHGRDLEVLRGQLAHHDTTSETQAWQQAAQRWERYGLSEWTFGDLPDQIVVADVAGFPLLAFPGLWAELNEVSLRLFRQKAEAAQAHGQGTPRLLELVLQREFAWMQKDLQGLAKWRDLYITLGPVEQLEATAFENIKQHLFAPRPAWPRTAAGFALLVEEIRAQLPGLATRISGWTGEILQLRQAILLCRKPYPQMRADLSRLLPPQFLRHVPWERLPHLPRYLKAVLVRAERASVNPAKDREKLDRIQPYFDAWARLSARPSVPGQTREALLVCRWLLEEYAVSLFAQELGTSEPVSPQRIANALAACAA